MRLREDLAMKKMAAAPHKISAPKTVVPKDAVARGVVHMPTVYANAMG
jgi:hypothetical protein